MLRDQYLQIVKKVTTEKPQKDVFSNVCYFVTLLAMKYNTTHLTIKQIYTLICILLPKETFECLSLRLSYT